jgi:hypothetical protein
VELVCDAGFNARPASAAARPATAVARPPTTSRPGTATIIRPQSAIQGSRTQASDSHGPCLQAVSQKCLLRPRSACVSQSGSPVAAEGHEQAEIAEHQACPWITTNEAFYGFRELYPETYNEAATATRARPGPNLMFLSEYAESMKRGTGSWKNMKSTTEAVNQSVHPPSVAQQVLISTAHDSQLH